MKFPWWYYYLLPRSLLKNVASKDFHKNNLKHLKKLSLRNREAAAAAAADAAAAAAADESGSGGRPPVKGNHNIGLAPTSPGNGKKKYGHVQSKIKEYKAAPPPNSPKTRYLRSHQKTGPFLPVSSNSNSVEDLTEVSRYMVWLQ